MQLWLRLKTPFACIYSWFQQKNCWLSTHCVPRGNFCCFSSSGTLHLKLQYEFCCIDVFNYALLFGLGSHSVSLRAYCWLYTQASLLAVLEGPDGMPWIQTRSAMCKAMCLPTILSLQLLNNGLFILLILLLGLPRPALVMLSGVYPGVHAVWGCAVNWALGLSPNRHVLSARLCTDP